MPITVNPNLPGDLETLEDVLTIVTFLRSKFEPQGSPREDLRLLDQASLRLCYLLVNHEAIAPDRQRQLLRLQLSLSQRLRQSAPPLHAGLHLLR